MRVAAMDLGTNTFLLLIAEVENGEIQRVLHDEVRVIRLGQGVGESRCFHADALKRADEAFQAYAKIITKFGPEKILACATSAARDVSNKQELFDIAARARIRLEIISGEREAELTFLGTIGNLESKAIPSPHLSLDKNVASVTRSPQIVIDVGGGSTEFIMGNALGYPSGDATGIQVRKSFDIGAVRLTESLVSSHPIPQNEILALKTRIQKEFLDIGRVFNVHLTPGSKTRFIAVAGTPTTLAALDLQQSFNPEKIDGYVLTRVRIREWIDRLAPMTLEQRCELVGMDPKRADVIVAGAMILESACAALNVKELEVSVRGLRYGIAKSLA